MKKLVLIFLFISCFCFSQQNVDTTFKKRGAYITNANEDIELMNAIYICGLCAIRNDALRMCRFRYAHELKKEIKFLTKPIKQK
jgi:hypothetical protein